MFRDSTGFSDAKFFFSEFLIDTKTSVENVHSIFVNVHKTFNSDLRESIKTLIEHKKLERTKNPQCYNYLIMDGAKLYKILERYNSLSLIPATISNKDFEEFKRAILYAGKGTNDRKFSHLIGGKQLLLKQLDFNKICAKFSKITQAWEKGHGVVVLHLFTETNKYEAMSREYAIIKALGLNNITNQNNSTPYGSMADKWNHKEVVNYGNMILYNTLKMAIQENPPIINEDDVTVPTKNLNDVDYRSEAEGILNCFLELLT